MLIDWYFEVFDLLAGKQVRALESAELRLHFSRFFFAFDGCGYLTRPNRTRISSDMPSDLTALLRILNESSTTPKDVVIWHFLVDTSPDLFTTAPRRPMTTSARLEFTYQLLPIWPYLTFDAMKNELPMPRNAKDTLKLQNLQFFWETGERQSM
jgi:hypothetical protein